MAASLAEMDVLYHEALTAVYHEALTAVTKQKNAVYPLVLHSAVLNSPKTF